MIPFLSLMVATKASSVGTFTEVKQRRPPLVLGWLGWVTVREEPSVVNLYPLIGSVTDRLYSRYRADTNVKESNETKLILPWTPS